MKHKHPQQKIADSEKQGWLSSFLWFGLVARIEPKATAVKLAQLGEGDSPQCGEMSRRDKGAGHPLNRGQAAPCREWIMSSNKNLRKLDKCCSPFKKHKKFL